MTETVVILVYLFFRKFFGIKIAFVERFIEKAKNEWSNRKAIKLAFLLGFIIVQKNTNSEEGK